MQPEKENAYWAVSNLTYQQTMYLANSELIENFQRDVRKLETKFWPGTKGTWKHLYDNLPEGATITNESGTQSWKRETAVLKLDRKPEAFKPQRKLGMQIADD